MQKKVKHFLHSPSQQYQAHDGAQHGSCTQCNPLAKYFSDFAQSGKD